MWKPPPLAKWLEQQGAQNDIVDWARAFGEDWERAWHECPRGDWLLAMASRVGVERTALVLAAAACASSALDCLPESEQRPRNAVETAIRWARGEAEIDELRRAAAEAEQAEVPDPAVAVAIASAHAAASAADLPEHAAAAAANAAQAALLGVADCAMLSALSHAQQSCADRVREQIPFSAFQSVLPHR